MAIFVRSGLSYDPIDTSPLLPQDTTTEWCAVRVFLQQQQQQQQLQQQQPRQQPQQQQQQQRARQYSHRSTHSYIDVFNIYRPPIRTSQQDERVNHFSMRFFPTGGNTLIVGDVSAHHPSWDDNCQMPDSVGDHIYTWELSNSWVTLNSGEPTYTQDTGIKHTSLRRTWRWPTAIWPVGVPGEQAMTSAATTSRNSSPLR